VPLSISDALASARTLQVGEPAWQPAVLAAANLLEIALDRVKHCENPDCVLWFFDTARNGTRRWCSMAVCGNRMKARRHYDQVKARLPAQNRIICMCRCKQHTGAFSRPDSAIRSLTLPSGYHTAS
jgi:CGNR zinc finger